MASIHKNNGPNWYAAYYGPEGTRSFKSTGTPDKRLALQIALQFEEAAKQARAERLTMKRVRDTLSGIYASVHGEELPADETGPFMKQWLERKESELADSSLVNYQKTINAFLKFIGPRKSKPLDSITKTIVTDWRDSLLKRVSPGTARKQIKILRAAFNDAVREGRARENPAAHVKLKQNESCTRLPFTDVQMISLLGAANQEWQGMILAAYTTGARLGDIASLDWDNVNLQAMEIHFSAIKTGQGMNLPLSDQLHDCLIRLPSYDTGGPVFPAAKATYARAGSSSLSKQFRKIMHDVGLAPKPNHRKTGDGRDAKRETSKYSFHCLRHSFVSNLKMSGAGDSIAKELAGHSSDAVSRIYTHGDPVALRAAVNKLPKLDLPSAKIAKTDKNP
jgi:integrase